MANYDLEDRILRLSRAYLEAASERDALREQRDALKSTLRSDEGQLKIWQKRLESQRDLTIAAGLDAAKYLVERDALRAEAEALAAALAEFGNEADWREVSLSGDGDVGDPDYDAYAWSPYPTQGDEEWIYHPNFHSPWKIAERAKKILDARDSRMRREGAAGIESLIAALESLSGCLPDPIYITDENWSSEEPDDTEDYEMLSISELLKRAADIRATGEGEK